MAISDWFKNLFKASSFQGTVYSDPVEPAIGIESGVALAERTMDGYRMGRVDGVSHVLKSTGNVRFSESFMEREVACRDVNRTMPTGAELINANLAAVAMEDIRSLLGGRPITVNSWYRTPAYNRQVGGAKNSYHTKGVAVDFTVEGLTPAQVQRKLIQARDSGKLAIGGIGRYKRWTHVDLGPKRTWEG